MTHAIEYARRMAAKRGRPQRVAQHGDKLLCGDIKTGEDRDGFEFPDGYIAIVFPDGSVRM